MVTFKDPPFETVQATNKQKIISKWLHTPIKRPIISISCFDVDAKLKKINKSWIYGCALSIMISIGAIYMGLCSRLPVRLLCNGEILWADF